MVVCKVQTEYLGMGVGGLHDDYDGDFDDAGDHYHSGGNDYDDDGGDDDDSMQDSMQGTIGIFPSGRRDCITPDSMSPDSTLAGQNMLL